MGGLPRSGTTLIRHLMDQAGQVSTFLETGFFLQPLWLLQDRVIRRPAKLAEALGLDAALVTATIKQGSGLIDTFDALVDASARQRGFTGRGWLDKTPRNCEVFHRLAREESNLVFVSIVRNGLDVVTSRMPGHRTKAADYWCSIQRYVDTIGHITSFEDERHLVIRYEDAVRDPGAVVTAIHRHAGLDIDDADMTFQPLEPEQPEAVRTPKLAQGISDVWVDRWRLPEHVDRVTEFLSNPAARHALMISGYDVPDLA